MILRLLKHPGFQRLAAAALGGGVTWVSVCVMSALPPEYWGDWPSRASKSLAYLITGSLSAAFCLWVYFTLRPIIARGNWLSVVCRLVVGATLLSGIGGLWQCCLGAYFLATAEEHATVPVLRAWLWTVGAPVAVGMTPLWCLDLYEWIKVNPHLRRWLWSGQGHAATWIRLHELRRHCRPFSRPRGRKAGILEEY